MAERDAARRLIVAAVDDGLDPIQYPALCRESARIKRGGKAGA
jgi:hypothetical protein